MCKHNLLPGVAETKRSATPPLLTYLPGGRFVCQVYRFVHI